MKTKTIFCLFSLFFILFSCQKEQAIIPIVEDQPEDVNLEEEEEEENQTIHLIPTHTSKGNADTSNEPNDNDAGILLGSWNLVNLTLFSP